MCHPSDVGQRSAVSLRSPTARRAATVAFVVYLLALAAAAFLPLPDVRSLTGERGEVRVNLALSRPDVLRSWEAERNVLMTIPFGILLPLVVRWRYELMVAACLGVTLLIETGQLLGSLAAGWAWRAFDVDDILLNTLGGLIGLALTGVALAVGRRPRRLPPHRYATGALAGAFVAWALMSTVTIPTLHDTVYACDSLPFAAVTTLPGGADAYAASDGSLCIRTPDGSAMSLPHDAGGASVATYEVDGATYELGVADADNAPTTDDADRPVEAVPVEGSALMVWETPLS